MGAKRGNTVSVNGFHDFGAAAYRQGHGHLRGNSERRQSPSMSLRESWRHPAGTVALF